MPRRVLYLGIDPRRYPKDGIELIHHPLIKTVPILELPENVKQAWPSVTHLLSTSPRAAMHWLSLQRVEGKVVVAIGEATAMVWREWGVEPLVAQESTQEGVIALLQTMQTPFVLYPRSVKARPLLADFLHASQIQHIVFDLYTTIFLTPPFLFLLDDVDEIVFTSPTTVEAFFSLYKTVPSHVQLSPIGPITKRALEKKI